MEVTVVRDVGAILVAPDCVVEVEGGSGRALDQEVPAGDGVEVLGLGGGLERHGAAAEDVGEGDEGLFVAGGLPLELPVGDHIVGSPTVGQHADEGGVVVLDGGEGGGVEVGLGGGGIAFCQGHWMEGERFRADVFGGEADAGHHHGVHEGPDAHGAVLKGLVVAVGEDFFVIEVVFDRVADAAELEVVPGAVDGASGAEQGVVEDADVALAAPGHQVLVGLVEQLAVAVEVGPELGLVLVPGGGGDGVAFAGGGVVVHDGEVQVARAGVPLGAVADAGVHFEAEVAADPVLGPEGGETVAVLSVEV